MSLKLVLSSKEILDKKFSFTNDGYNPFDVDEYLDKVIEDYKLVEENLLVKQEEIQILEERIKSLISENDILNSELNNYKKRFEGLKTDENVSINNIDYLQRISKLETALWKVGVDPKKIK